MLGLARDYYGAEDEITRVLAGLEGSFKVDVVLVEARLRSSAAVAAPNAKVSVAMLCSQITEHILKL